MFFIFDKPLMVDDEQALRCHRRDVHLKFVTKNKRTYRIENLFSAYLLTSIHEPLDKQHIQYRTHSRDNHDMDLLPSDISRVVFFFSSSVVPNTGSIQPKPNTNSTLLDNCYHRSFQHFHQINMEGTSSHNNMSSNH